LFAVLVGGDERHLNDNVLTLFSRRIPVAAVFYDSWAQDEFESARPDNKPKYHKAVVVFPEEKEVFIQGETPYPVGKEHLKTGWRRLYP
jgi:hypothetical protein